MPTSYHKTQGMSRHRRQALLAALVILGLVFWAVYGRAL